MVVHHWSDDGMVMYHRRSLVAEMEKRADTADISVLFFFGCAIFLAVYAQTSEKHCAKSTLPKGTLL